MVTMLKAKNLLQFGSEEIADGRIVSSVVSVASASGLSVVEDEFLFVQDHNVFWAHMFSKYFIDSPDDTHKDDMLFYVRKRSPDSNHGDDSPLSNVRICFPLDPS